MVWNDSKSLSLWGLWCSFYLCTYLVFIVGLTNGMVGAFNLFPCCSTFVSDDLIQLTGEIRFYSRDWPTKSRCSEWIPGQPALLRRGMAQLIITFPTLFLPGDYTRQTFEARQWNSPQNSSGKGFAYRFSYLLCKDIFLRWNYGKLGLYTAASSTCMLNGGGRFLA